MEEFLKAVAVILIAGGVLLVVGGLVSKVIKKKN